MYKIISTKKVQFRDFFNLPESTLQSEIKCKRHNKLMVFTIKIVFKNCTLLYKHKFYKHIQTEKLPEIKHMTVTYLPRQFHLIHLIYQSSSIHFMYCSPTHSFPSHSFYRSQSISFTFTILGITYTASQFNLIVSFIFQPIWSL